MFVHKINDLETGIQTTESQSLTPEKKEESLSERLSKAYSMADTPELKQIAARQQRRAVAAAVNKFWATPIIKKLTSIAYLISTSHRQSKHIEELFGKSDEELRAIGISRHEIWDYTAQN